MAAKLKLESMASRQMKPNRRRVSRLFSQSEVVIRSSHDDRCKGRIRDVSTFGCSIESDADWMRSGMFISLVISAEWTIQAIVRWSREGRAGVEFLRPISEAEAQEISAD